MPIYEYQCQQCGRRSESLQKLNDPLLTTCEVCGGPLKKLISSPAVQFKGSGWYVTDYARKNPAGSTSGGSKGEGDAKSGSGSSGGDSGAKGESKSEGKSESKGDGGSSSSSGSSSSGGSSSAKTD